MESHESLGLAGVAWRLGATLLLVLLNGFFVAAEFALVRVRRATVVELAHKGRASAKMAKHILDHLDRYLSACQLGITLASLALGALGEPAVAALLIQLLSSLGVSVSPDDPVIRWTAFLFAFATITVLHITLGEQAPKMWALRNAKATTLQVAYPVQIFTVVFSPFISAINSISNAMLRAIGMPAGHDHEPIPTAGDIKSALTLSAQAGQISEGVKEIMENALRSLELQVRHIVVPRSEVVLVSLARSAQENAKIMQQSFHTRFPVCEDDLDTVIGFIHGKDLFLQEKPFDEADLRRLARPLLYVPDSKSLGEFVTELQRNHMHVAVVVDEHGSPLGMAFLEDAIEEILGPMGDEFDVARPPVVDLGEGVYEVRGAIPLPDAVARLGLEIEVEETNDSTLGGHVVSHLDRLPAKGDVVTIGKHKITVIELTRRRVVGRLRVEPVKTGEDDA